MFNPVSTYRIQFHKEFTFTHFEQIIPYLTELGIKTVYASPVFESTPGSTHGYDGVNPLKINPEIGNEEQLKRISKKLNSAGISWLQDIVPNHMAYHPNNAWLMDVLEKGRNSKFADFFDITWDSTIYNGQVMAPFLGGQLDEAIANGEIQIAYDGNRFNLKYYDFSLPLKPSSYLKIFDTNPHPTQSIGELVTEIDELGRIDEPTSYALKWHEILLQLNSLMKVEEVGLEIHNKVKNINTSPSELLEISTNQVYRFCNWQETDSQINYRRFFTINGLICLNIQRPEVFEAYHSYIAQLVRDGIFQGVRIDHIDGLYNPTEYLNNLRKLLGPEVYIVVEKILEKEEELPRTWMIQGNTGYDFLAVVNNLFTNKKNEELFTEFYEKITGNNVSIKNQIAEKKKYILYNHMQGELENLYALLISSNIIAKENLAKVDKEIIKEAIAEFLIYCPVYRFYGDKLTFSEEETHGIRSIINQIRTRKDYLSHPIDILESVLLENSENSTSEFSNNAIHFYMRCMQFTGPLMAKGVEDTLMYTYNRFIGHNEVGDSPDAFGISVKRFHKYMIKRQKYWPLTINATSTHDTKRGEDVSACLNVLTDLGSEWISLAKKWLTQNEISKPESLDVNDEYFIYQTLIGTFPFEGNEDIQIYKNRLKEYLTKAFREAKINSNWTKPDENYENTAIEYTYGLLEKESSFFKSFTGFQEKISDYGILNSLNKVILKFTCPGVPDTYQGTELWDLSMVDPDNRRPVEYKNRIDWLKAKSSSDPSELKDFVSTLWKKRNNGEIKLWLTNSLLSERNSNPDLFSKGFYIPLEVKGKYKDNIVAFARRYKNQWYIVVVPIHLAIVAEKQNKNTKSINWKDTSIIIPPEAPSKWLNVFENTTGKGNHLYIGDLFQSVPFALVKLQANESERGAGVLMHITSLPSYFGVGDLGIEARAFASFLSRCNQKYWQILPLNPTEDGQGHSPYSSISSMAGNTMLISPALLVTEGLLTEEDLKPHYLPSKERANFKESERVKEYLFQKAFEKFNTGNFSSLETQFALFCEEQNKWIQDFATYVVLKKHHGSPWYEWPEEFRIRNEASLKRFNDLHSKEIEKVKWLQFIFSRQWNGLKTYCNNLGIRLFGDLPFYISYDSVDVWSTPEIFSLDKDGKMKGVAGVPPDYFNSDGQLWGMPVFKWDVLKERGYDWWVNRIKKNMELFDILRLDHFRAFADYWEVPAGETTAIKGEWRLGPGIDFFNYLESKLGKLPFIAEDLGDISDIVIDLRRQTNLPGMKVLQFAFGDDHPVSDFIPHNYESNFVVYTGTHDNNTTVGWFRQDAGKKERKNVEKYCGIPVTEKNIHHVLGRIAYGSVAKIVIIPMQDLLGLDEKARMNIPSSTDKNWQWRMKPGQLKEDAEKLLRDWTRIYNR